MEIASAQFLVFQNLIQLPITNSAIIIAYKWFPDIINIVNIWNSAIFSGTPPHFVCFGWTPWKLSILDVFQRYLKWRNTFDTLCLNFFYILDGPISVDLHQVKFQDNSNILRYFVNLKHIWQCQRLSQKHKEMLPKLVFRWKNP